MQMDENKGVFGRTLNCKCPQPLNLEPKKFNRFLSKWFESVLVKKENEVASRFLFVMPLLQKHLPEKTNGDKSQI